MVRAADACDFRKFKPWPSFPASSAVRPQEHGVELVWPGLGDQGQHSPESAIRGQQDLHLRRSGWGLAGWARPRGRAARAVWRFRFV